MTPISPYITTTSDGNFCNIGVEMKGYRPVRQCIYCGTTSPPRDGRRKPKFGKEHIIPFALGGNDTLPQATCTSCQETINLEVETPILHEELAALRIGGDLPTRDKKGRARRLEAISKGWAWMNYDYPPASCLTQEPITPLPYENPTLKLIHMPTQEVRHTATANPRRFARLVARIGHAFAVAEMGPNSFFPFLQGFILGKDKNYRQYVGGSVQSASRKKLSVGFVTKKEKDAVMVMVMVNPLPESPLMNTYHAVVGEIRQHDQAHRAFYDRNYRRFREFYLDQIEPGTGGEGAGRNG